VTEPLTTSEEPGDPGEAATVPEAASTPAAAARRRSLLRRFRFPGASVDPSGSAPDGGDGDGGSPGGSGGAGAAVRGHRHLLTGSSVLIIGAAVQGLGGMVFSLIVAKWDTKDAFGDASALFTSVLFVTYLAGLGLPVSLARYSADRSRDSHVVFAWGAIATAVASVVASAFYLGVFRPGAARNVLWDWNPVAGFALFAVIVMGSAFSLIIDVRAMTMRRWNLVLLRIVAVGVAKIALLPLGRHATHRPLLLFLYLAAPVAVSGFVGLALINRTTGGRHRLSPRPITARAATRYSLVNYVSTLAYQAPYFALPVIVLMHVDSATNSSFYVAWSVVAIAFYVPSAIGQALLAEGGKDGAHVRTQMRLAMILALGLMAAGALVSFLGKSVVVMAYGEDYRDSAHVLPAMMLAGVPWAVSSLLLTEARVLHRHVATVAITLCLTVSIIVPALVLVPGEGAHRGLNGASAAWLIGNLVSAAVAIVVTTISRRRADDHRAEAELDPLAPVI